MSHRKGWSIDPLLLIVGIIVLAQILTYVVPQGEFEHVPVPGSHGRTAVVPGTYEPLPPEQQVVLMPWHFLVAIPHGLAAAQDVIFLVFLIGGVIALLRRTGAIDALLQTAVARLGHSPWILIAGCLVLFATGSYAIGMGEEYVPLLPILLTMCLALRLDAMVAMALVWVPYGIGWACAGFNPFGVVIAQSIAGLPPASGALPRAVMMVVFLAFAFAHIHRYARRVRTDPAQSLLADLDQSTALAPAEPIALTPRRIAVLGLLAAGIVGFVIGAKLEEWYIVELNAVFLGVGLLAVIVARMPAGEASSTFLRGAAEMTTPALVIGFARTIQVVLDDGQIKETVVAAIAGLLDGAGPDIAAVGMLAVQAVCNFFIPSGSGQAYVTMPIMSPLATLTGVPQQTAVLAYQLGDGITNMVLPTNALVMGTLALGKIPYGRWVRFLAPLLLQLFALAIVVLLLSVHLPGLFGLER